MDNKLISFPGSITEEFGNTIPAPLVIDDQIKKENSNKSLKLPMIERDMTHFIAISSLETGEQLLVSTPQTINIPKIKVNNGTRRNKCIALTLTIGLIVIISIIVGIIISMKSSSSGQEINSIFLSNKFTIKYF